MIRWSWSGITARFRALRRPVVSFVVEGMIALLLSAAAVVIALLALWWV